MEAPILPGPFSFAPRLTEGGSFALLERNLAHVIATDAHTLVGRGPVLTPAVAQAASRIGRERAEAMVTTTPEAIINNREVAVPPPTHVQAQRGFLELRIWCLRCTPDRSKLI
ncbi:MAG: hypothetical protein M1305_07410 [Candidatus Marsarchaeota archaeon]|nr:hypothetical protein [Candidatus Marsarchaeota archaeon]